MSDDTQIITSLKTLMVNKGEQDFRQIFDALPVAVYTTDAEGRLTYYNSEAEKICGRKPELGSDFWCVAWKIFRLDGSPIPKEESAMAKAMQEERSLSAQNAVVERPDGKRVWIESYPSPLRNEEGEIIGGVNMLLDVTNRKMAEKRLEESESKYRTLFESIDQGFAIIDVIFDEEQQPIDLLFMKANPAFKEQTGLQDYVIEGKTITKIAEERDSTLTNEWALIMGKVAHTGESLRFDKEAETSDRYYEVYAFPYGEGKSSRVGVLFEDISERKKHELANARLGAIVKSSQDAVISKDLNGIIATWNASAEKMFGYTKEEAIGQPITMLFPEDRLDEEDDILQHLEDRERIHHFETVRLHKDGTPIDVSLSISPVVRNGKVIGGSKVARDITHRKKAEKALKESEEKYRTLFETMDEGFNIVELIYDDNGQPIDYCYLETNPAFEKHTGLNNVEGKTGNEVTPMQEYYWIEKLAEVDKNRSPIRFKDYGREVNRYFDVNAFPIGASEEHKVAVLIQDISAQKRYQEKLEEKVEERTASLKSYQEQLRLLASELSKAEERERQRLATDLHDNLGQMLAVSKMKMEGLSRQAKSEEIVEEIEDLKSLIDKSIAYSRKLMTDLKPPPSLDRENLEENIRWIAQKMAKHDLEVEIEDDGKEKMLSEDVRTTIFQCTRELLFNIVKHAGVEKARIDLSRPDGYVKVTVKDNGKGFELKNKQPMPTNKGGFGLFSIRERLNVLGGNMEIQSHPGEGTTVIMRVPVKAEEGSKVAELAGTNEETSPQFNQKKEPIAMTKVLIVDDHQMMREGLRKMIEEEDDMDVVAEASDGEEAVKKAKQYNPDVVVMDVNMPGLNGMDATRKVIAHNSNIRVVGLSFHEEKSVAEAMRRAGATAYLTKSDVFETLCATIRSEVQTSGRQQTKEE